jgi:hypothetical protein
VESIDIKFGTKIIIKKKFKSDVYLKYKKKFHSIVADNCRFHTFFNVAILNFLDHNLITFNAENKKLK